MQNTYHRIDASFREVRGSGQNDVRFRAIKSNGEECQANHCQPQSTNIGDKQVYRVNILVQLGQGQNYYMFLHMAICQSLC